MTNELFIGLLGVIMGFILGIYFSKVFNIDFSSKPKSNREQEDYPQYLERKSSYKEESIPPKHYPELEKPYQPMVREYGDVDRRLVPEYKEKVYKKQQFRKAMTDVPKNIGDLNDSGEVPRNVGDI